MHPKPADQTTATEEAIPESHHGDLACRMAAVICEGAIALGDQEHTLDSVRRASGAVILEVVNGSIDGEVTDPHSVSSLLWPPWWTSRSIRNGCRGWRLSIDLHFYHDTLVEGLPGPRRDSSPARAAGRT